MAYNSPRIARVVVSATSDGANTAVTAVAGETITLLSAVLTTVGTGGFIWKSDSTALAGKLTLTAGQPLVVPHDDKGHLQTATGQSLVITTDTGVDVLGHITVRFES